MTRPGDDTPSRRELCELLGISIDRDPVARIRDLRDTDDKLAPILGMMLDGLSVLQCVELLEHKNQAALRVYKLLGIDTIGLYNPKDVDERLLLLVARIERLKHCEEIVKAMPQLLEQTATRDQPIGSGRIF